MNVRGKDLKDLKIVENMKTKKKRRAEQRRLSRKKN